MTITIDLKLIKNSDAPKEVVEVYKFLKAFSGSKERSDWLKRRKEAWDLIENDLWSDSEIEAMGEEKQLPLVDNKVKKGIQGSCAIVTDQKPEIKFFPIGGGDLYVAELLKRGHDLVWEKNEGNDVTYDYCEENKASGISFIEAWHDESRGIFGREVFEESSPVDWYWDPHARKRDLSDSHLIKGILRSKTYIKERYPDLKEEDFFFHSEKQDSHVSSGITTGDNYTIAEDQPNRDTIEDQEGEPENIWELWAWMLKTKHEDWIIIPDEKGKPDIVEPMELEPKQDPEEAAKARKGTHWPRKIEKRILRHIVGRAIIKQTDESGNEVDELENPHGMDADGDPVLPVIALRGQRTRNAYPMGVVAYARDLNKISSKAFMNFFHAAAHLINAPIVTTDEARWTGHPGTPGSQVVIPKTTPGHLVPHRMQPGAFQIQQWLTIKTQADQDIFDAFDMPDVMRGKVPEGQQNMSGRLGLALQDLAGMMSKPFLRSLETALVKLAKANIALMLQNWPRYLWERLIEKDEMENWLPEEERLEREAEAEEQGGLGGPSEDPDEDLKREIAQRWQHALDIIDPNEDMGDENLGGVIDIDVKLTAGSSMPTNRMAKMQVGIELAGAGIYDRQAVLEYVDDPNRDAIVARMKRQDEALAQQELLGKKK